MTTTLLNNKIQKSLKGHLSSTIQTTPTEQVKKNNMGVYVVIKKNPRGKTLMYVGATTNTKARFANHRSNFGNRGLAFFQIVSVPSSPMLAYIEQIALNTLRSLRMEKFKILNSRQPAFDCIEKNTSIKNRLVEIINRFENGERGYSLS